MGNIFNKFNTEKYTLLENSDDILHKLDTNTEEINKIKSIIDENNKTNTENFELIQQDMDKLFDNIKDVKQEINYLLSHQSSSRYGGLLPDKLHDSLEGPSDTMFSTSE